MATDDPAAAGKSEVTLFGRRYDTAQPIRLVCREGVIARCDPVDCSPRDAIDWPYVAPGLFDVQVNGYGGREYASAGLTVDDVVRTVEAMAGFGVTRFCPTVTTESFAVQRHAMATLAEACRRWPELARRMPAVHLEGPYITSQDGARGAHPKAHCRPPDWEEFRRLQDAAGQRIRLVTLSPEYAEAPAFIARAVESGVVVAIGHTAAANQQIDAAVAAGARMSTHLGNGSHIQLHRLRNYLWRQLADDRLWASLIADGHHLPPEVLRVFVRAKSPSRCVLISDLSGQAGQAPGRYANGFCEVEVLDDGRLVVAGQRELLGGAAAPLGHGIAQVMHDAGLDLATAVEMASAQPARLLRQRVGSLAPGEPADIVQFRLGTAEEQPVAEFVVVSTVIGGQPVFGSPWPPG